MSYLQNLKSKYVNTGSLFPEFAYFLFDEIERVFDKTTNEETLRLLNGNGFSDYIHTVVKKIEFKKQIEHIDKLTKNDPVYRGMFFNGNMLDITQAQKYLTDNSKEFKIELSDIVLLVIDEMSYTPFNESLKGYELIGFIALYWLQKAMKISSKEVVKVQTGKHCKQLQKIMNHNEGEAMKFCLLSAEAVAQAHHLKHSRIYRTLIETAKYLIEKAKKEHNDEIAKKAISDNAKKAVNTRHSKTNELRQRAIEEFKLQNESKNKFSAKFAKEHKLAFTTVRNNWLQGI
ncbi:hypothetical protein [Actinobacillus minor]|uniref:hypothetical protein n=1 Tax=Actinobacillus minor TaxID=51047 RepID=UPI0023F2DCE9|nr:hypothetical protein [Actinobacillus minor]MDD6910420.1 hypothetical protein [Actinobacillus minor]MDY4714099.1 hypothetical protein [Actinobacillus minor]